MPKMDKNEALAAVRKLLDKTSAKPMTIFKKEISNLPVSALNQLHDFLVREVLQEPVE